MKFNCGPDKYERAVIKENKLNEKCEQMRKGVKKFAWLPTRVGSGDCRWLEHYFVKYRCRVDTYYYPRIEVHSFTIFSAEEFEKLS